MTQDSLPKLTLVLGAAASGKSLWAENLLAGSGLQPVYVATGAAGDAEMAAKITRHRDRRGAEWRTIEAQDDLPAALAGIHAGEGVLLDCLTMWLTARLLRDDDFDHEAGRLLAAVPSCAGPVVAVSNEVGAGIVPADALSRRFREAQGAINQRVAAAADAVTLVVAGLPLRLKGPA